MTAENQFKPFATGDGATALPAATYGGLVSLIAQGFQAGIVPPEEFNTVMRGPTSMAAMVGQFIADRANEDALDNGDIATLLQRFEDALMAFLQPLGVYYVPDTGTANKIVGTTTFPPASYTAVRLVIVRKMGADNTGAMQINLWGKGDVSLKDNTGADFASGAVKASSYYALVPDGGGFRVIGGATSYTNVTNLTANSGDMIGVTAGTGVVDFRTNRGTHETVPANLSDTDRLPYGRSSDDHAMYQTRAEFLAWLKGKFPDALAPLSYNATLNRYEIAQASTTTIGVVRRATKAEVLARTSVSGQPVGYVAVDDLPGSSSGIAIGSVVTVPATIGSSLISQISLTNLIGQTLTGERFRSINSIGLFNLGPCIAPGALFVANGMASCFWWDSRRDLFDSHQTWTIRAMRCKSLDGNAGLIDIDFECTAIAP